MVAVRSIDITPPLINTAWAWASDEAQLGALFDCPHTGAVTTRTITLCGFEEDASHTVAFLKGSVSSMNTYGYSPHPLLRYIGPDGWLRTLLERTPDATKPVLVSVTEANASDLGLMLATTLGRWAARVELGGDARGPCWLGGAQGQATTARGARGRAHRGASPFWPTEIS